MRSDEARVDISTRSFWQERQVAFFLMFWFLALSCSPTLTRCNKTFTSNEIEKRLYNQRIISIEHGTDGGVANSVRTNIYLLFYSDQQFFVLVEQRDPKSSKTRINTHK